MEVEAWSGPESRSVGAVVFFDGSGCLEASGGDDLEARAGRAAMGDPDSNALLRLECSKPGG